MLGRRANRRQPPAEPAGCREVREVRARIGLEVTPTGPAVRTYNILFAEGRRVGAALIAVD